MFFKMILITAVWGFVSISYLGTDHIYKDSDKEDIYIFSNINYFCILFNI